MKVFISCTLGTSEETIFLLGLLSQIRFLNITQNIGSFVVEQVAKE